MKFVLNKCYGGFGLSETALRELGIPYIRDDGYVYITDPDIDLDSLRFRSSPELVRLVELDSEEMSGDLADLKVIEIPDNATDYDLDEYDGVETLIYVVDGKIHRI